MAKQNVELDQKAELLGVIRRAKSAHIRWRAYAQALVSGLPITEEQAPTIHTECVFGKWYYSEGSDRFAQSQAFEDLARPHEMLHSVYQRIFELVNNGQMDEAKGELDELMGISRTLLDNIELLEQEVEMS